MATVKTNTTYLNVRKGPSKKSARIGTLRNGDEVTVLEYDDEWCKIQYNDEEAYVASEFIDNSDEDFDDIDDEAGEFNFVDLQDKMYEIADALSDLIDRLREAADSIG